MLCLIVAFYGAL